MKASVHARGGGVWGHDAYVRMSARGVYGETARACGMCVWFGGAVVSRGYTPFIQPACSREGKDNTLALGRRW
eukprot:4196314-Pleurochrysis_carterae.AAC.1